MKRFDGIGIQINIDDNWPSDVGARKKLRQCSDYIEMINDLRECLRIIDVLEKLHGEDGFEFQFMKEVDLSPIPPGTFVRSMDSAFYSKYGRCFNSSEGRVTFNNEISKRILGEQLYEFHSKLISIRNQIISHAHDIEGRQPITVINWEDEKSRWEVDLSGSNDLIPQWSPASCEATRQCCHEITDYCFEKVEATWKSFRGMLSEREAQSLRNKHYTNDKTGSGYPVEPPASTRK